MKKALSLLAIVSLLFFVSCKKETIDNNPVQPAPVQDILNSKLLVKTNQFHDETTLEYYPDRRVKTFSYKNPGNPLRRIDFTYGLETITLIEYRDNVKESVWTYELNAKGQLNGCLYQGYDDNGTLVYENVSTYQYNAEGQMIKEDQGNGNYAVYSYQNGNLFEYTYYQSNQLVLLSKYEFYTDKPAKYLSYGQHNSYGLGAVRKLSKNLIKHQVTTQWPGQNIIFDGEYTYELDNEGFVKKGKWVDAITANTREWTNTFQ